MPEVYPVYHRWQDLQASCRWLDYGAGETVPWEHGMAKTSNGTRSWSIALFGLLFSGMGALAMAGYHHAERKGHPVMETRVGRLERDYDRNSKSIHLIERLVLKLSINAGIDISIP